MAYVTVYMGDCRHHVVRVCDNMIFAHSRLSRGCDNVNNGLSVGLSTNRKNWSVGDEDICHLVDIGHVSLMQCGGTPTLVYRGYGEK